MKLHAKRPKLGAARLKWYRRKRRKAGQEDPLPQWVGTFNCRSVSTSRRHAERICIAALERGNVVTLLNEVGKVDVQAVADRHFGKDFFRAVQFGRNDSPEMGSAIAIRLDRAEIHKDDSGRERVELVRYSKRGRKVRDRFSVRAHITVDPGTPNGWTQGYETSHSPLPSTGQQEEHRRSFTRSKSAIKGGDTNTRRARIRAWAGGYKVRGKRGVLFLFFASWIPVSDARMVPGDQLSGADHPGVEAQAWPNKNKTAPKWRKSK